MAREQGTVNSKYGRRRQFYAHGSLFTVHCALAFMPCALFTYLACPVFSETVVDVSHEWNARASSSSAPAFPNPSANVKPSPAPATTAEEPVCACESMSVQECLDDSTYAFTGMVVEASAPKKGKRTAVFDVNEIFKGTPTQEMKVSAEVTGSSCDLNFEEAQNYLVYAKWEWGTVITSRCMGTKLLVKAKNELGPSQALKDKLYIKLRNACMGRYDTPCCLSSLEAMRKDYYLPEPEEGCPSGMIPDRLHCAGSYNWCIPVTEKTHQ